MGENSPPSTLTSEVRGKERSSKEDESTNQVQKLAGTSTPQNSGKRPLHQGGKRPGGETGSPLLVPCVMRRRTGKKAPSALQSCVEVSASLTNVGSLAVGAFDLVNCSLSVFGFVPVFHVCRQVS